MPGSEDEEVNQTWASLECGIGEGRQGLNFLSVRSQGVVIFF